MSRTPGTEGFYLVQWRLAGNLIVWANVKRPALVVIDEPDCPLTLVMVLPDWAGAEYANVMAAYVIMELRLRVSGPVGLLSRLCGMYQMVANEQRFAAD